MDRDNFKSKGLNKLKGDSLFAAYCTLDIKKVILRVYAPIIILARHDLPDSSQARVGTISRNDDRREECCQNGSASEKNGWLE